MTDGVSFLFSGSVLTHRHAIKTLRLCNNIIALNVASYGNKGLSTHIENSFGRKSNK